MTRSFDAQAHCRRYCLFLGSHAGLLLPRYLPCSPLLSCQSQRLLPFAARHHPMRGLLGLPLRSYRHTPDSLFNLGHRPLFAACSTASHSKPLPRLSPSCLLEYRNVIRSCLLQNSERLLSPVTASLFRITSTKLLPRCYKPRQLNLS